jgi:hypothetical protein
MTAELVLRVRKDVPSREGKLISCGTDDFGLSRVRGHALRVSLLGSLAVRLLPERRFRRCSVVLVDTCSRSSAVSSAPIDPLAAVAAVVVIMSS